MTGIRKLILGSTQSGKSWNMYHADHVGFQGCAIYVDPKPSDYIRESRSDSITITQARQILSQDKNYYREIILKPDTTLRSKIIEEAHKLMYIVLKSRMKGKRNHVQISFDEAHRFGNKFTSSEMFYQVFGEGAATNIHANIATQHGRHIRDDIIMNCDIIKVFGYDQITAAYVERKAGLVVEEHKAWLLGKYHGIQFDGKYVYRIDSAGKVYSKHLNAVADSTQYEHTEDTEEEEAPDDQRDRDQEIYEDLDIYDDEDIINEL
jgi:hypothetical protein